MINGLEGIPGSGKSYEACVFQVLAALKEGRKVITNLPLMIEAYSAIDPGYRQLIELRYAAAPVRGKWDAEGIDPETGQGEAFQLFEDGHTDPAPEGSNRFGTVWCYWTDWKHPKTGRGPLFVIDECHVAMPKLGTQKAVIEWYKLHRHFNADVLLATQRFRDMCQDIAGLMAMVIKVRKADVLGKPDEYIRKVHAGYRGAVIQESLRKYEPHFFALYKSHTQGNSVLEAQAADVAPLSIKLKRWTRVVWGLSAVAIAFAVFVLSRDDRAKVPAGKEPDTRTALQVEKPNQPAAPDIEGAREADPVGRPEALVDPEPYGGKGLHLTGVFRMNGRVLYTFAVSSSGAVLASVTSDDLVQAGYRWQPLTDCSGYLRWGNSATAITCDAPMRQAGSPDKPIVMRDGYSSDGTIVPAPREAVLLGDG